MNVWPSGRYGWPMRSLYLPPFRIDLDRRPDIARLVPDRAVARAIARALDAAGAPAPAAVALTLSDDAALAELNATHMGKDGPTDVLSFPLLPPEAFPPHQRGRPRVGETIETDPGDHAASAVARVATPFPLPPGARQPLGDIVVSVERAIEQAEAGRGGQTGDVRWSAADELLLLVTHGTLHLCGWDHAEPDEEAAMRALERRLLSGPRP